MHKHSQKAEWHSRLYTKNLDVASQGTIEKKKTDKMLLQKSVAKHNFERADILTTNTEQMDDEITLKCNS